VNIKILGTGCARCNALENLTRKAVEELKIDVAVEKVGEIEKIMEYGVMRTPGLVIDDKLKLEGVVPTLTELKMMIYQNFK